MADEDKIVEVYERMLALPEAQRAAFLQQALSDENERELVEMLYKHEHAQAQGITVEDFDNSQEHAEPVTLLGSTIGSYQLTEILGRGGSATVYLAERIDQRYSAQVAIKVLDHPQAGVAPREQSEWQILADLTHPDIARILDAGELADGRPYFIMEYVSGLPIDHYCDRDRLGLADRLQLFLRVCAAVQFAHERLVIHRDLKPLNILISQEGAPKLLDFGIATLLGAADPTRSGVFDAEDQPRGTAAFASPEQIRGEALTTASDVYALGVVLYGLLTGLSPYGGTSRILPAEESALYTPPQVPSSAVMQAYEAPQQRDIVELLSSARGLSARALARNLEGDLDAITLKALSKEVSARYSSVEQFAADIRRYLKHEAVHAREGTWFYVAGRFVRRHRFSVAAAVVAATVLLTGTTVLLVQNKRIRAEHARAEMVSEFMLNVFSASDPFVSHGKQMTAGELLDQAGRRILTDPTLEDSVRADLLLGIGRAYRRQDLSEESLPYLTEALRLRSRLPADPLQLANVYAELALAYRSIGRLEDSEAAFNAALQASATRSGSRSPAQVRLLTEIGRLEVIKGALDQAQHHFDEALDLARQLFGAQHAEVASIQLDRANVAFLRDDYGHAVRWAEEAVALNERLLPLKHPDRVMSQYILASILTQSGEVRRAEQLFEKVLPTQRQLYGRNSPKVADTLDALSVLHRRQGHHQLAERYAREALQIQQQAQSTDHYMVGYFHVQLALALFDEGRNAQAHEQLTQALEIYAKTLPEEHEFRAAAEHWLGEVALAEGQFDIAAQALESAISRWQRTGAPAWRVARSQNTLAVVVGRRGDCKRAEVLLRQSVEAMANDTRADPDALAKARQRQKQFACHTAQSTASGGRS